MKPNFINPEIANLIEAKKEIDQLIQETNQKALTENEDTKDHLALLDKNCEWLQFEIDQLKEKLVWTFRFQMIIGFSMLGMFIGFWFRVMK